MFWENKCVPTKMCSSPIDWGQVPLRNPFAGGDWGAAETLPLLDELFDDYSHIDYR